jgi:hypothetical protein
VRGQRHYGELASGSAPRRGLDELHRHVESVMTWPVNEVLALDAVLGFGVTAVISDETPVLAELMARGL